MKKLISVMLLLPSAVLSFAQTQTGYVRTFGVTKVPQEIVMVSLTEKNKIRRKVEEQVEARYMVKYDGLQRKPESKEIEAEDYHRQLQELESFIPIPLQ